MAPQSSHYGATALVELATLINLLFLRAGNVINSAAPENFGLDADLDTDDGDGDDSSDSEVSANTAQRDELSQAHGHLRRRFLNRLAELFAAERNGRFVTAAVFREEEHEARVDVWLARNNGFETHKDKKMIAAVETALNQLANEREWGATELWNHMLQYSVPRLHFYQDKLKATLAQHRAELEQIGLKSSISLADEEARILSDIYSHFFKPPRPRETDIQRLEHLVHLGADVRRATHAGNDLSKLLGKSAWTRKIVTILCLVGKFTSAFDTFAEASTAIWQGYTFKLNVLEPTAPFNLPKVKTDLVSALEGACTTKIDPAIKAYFSKPKVEATFAVLQKRKPHVHAEVQLLFYLARNKITNVFPYVGASKLPCILCAGLLKADGNLTCRESHKHLYARWMVPDMKTLPQDVKQRLWDVIEKLKEDLRRSLFSSPKKGTDPRPESTIDLTEISRLTVEVKRDSDSAIALALQQRLEAKEQEELCRLLGLQLSGNSDSSEVDDSVDEDDPTSSQHAYSNASDGESEYECGGCPHLTSRRCGRCGKDFFCSTFCEGRMTATHKFICSNGALTTADYLMLDCAADKIPKDPDVLRDFGFARLLSSPERSKLLGLYQGLQMLDIRADELHNWQLSGMLADQIIEAFEKIPVKSRGDYFPWFIENKHLIFPASSPAIDNDAFERMCRPAKFMLGPIDCLRAVSELQPVSKRAAFIFAALTMQLTYPPPEFEGPYHDFGFCSCQNESEEEALGILYQRLLFGDNDRLGGLYWGEIQVSSSIIERFSQFYKAFENEALVQLMDDHGLKRQRLHLRHLETYLSGSTKVQCLSVWKLLTFLKTGDAEVPPREVFVDFRFFRCTNPLVRGRLKRLYSCLLAQADILQLEQARATGRLLEFVEQYAEIDADMKKILY
ncbi:unnamed protein product [Zymoseptoria tritici ST99CH_1E4]|uniref:MYND-type domain-containing protein n=1 Tax=Zymoseptoria tritici ST99CH_1E4 TaxID=1276532 RepID=A0A2H1H5I2_ZYMTR|nr:unnamed protein product [Zymoseptoria tritici ST99CH_1E4]